jgi:uncharacterized membrane protein (DUF106 family)
MVLGLPPFQEVFLFSLALSLATTLMSKFLANQGEIKRSKKNMQMYKEKASKAQKAGDLKKANEYMSEMMKASQKQLRLNMRPMMLSFGIFIFAATWFGTTYVDLKVLSPLSIPFIGAELNWAYWYILIVLPASTIFRKAFDIA